MLLQLVLAQLLLGQACSSQRAVFTVNVKSHLPLPRCPVLPSRLAFSWPKFGFIGQSQQAAARTVATVGWHR